MAASVTPFRLSPDGSVSCLRPRLPFPGRGYASTVEDMTETGPTLYDLLGVEPNATQDEIKAAWREASKANHPDAAGGKFSSARFRNIKEAYEVLSDPARRRAYDESLKNRSSRSTPPPPPREQSGGYSSPPYGSTDDSSSGRASSYEEAARRREQARSSSSRTYEPPRRSTQYRSARPTSLADRRRARSIFGFRLHRTRLYHGSIPVHGGFLYAAVLSFADPAVEWWRSALALAVALAYVGLSVVYPRIVRREDVPTTVVMWLHDAYLIGLPFLALLVVLAAEAAVTLSAPELFVTNLQWYLIPLGLKAIATFRSR